MEQRTEATTYTERTTLYERLGGAEGIAAIVDDFVGLHLENPAVSSRFRYTDIPHAKRMARDFFGVGSGGPEVYSGKDMRHAHGGMNIDEREFVAVIDDILAALDRNGVGEEERKEVLAILYSMKGEIVHQ